MIGLATEHDRPPGEVADRGDLEPGLRARRNALVASSQATPASELGRYMPLRHAPILFERARSRSQRRVTSTRARFPAHAREDGLPSVGQLLLERRGGRKARVVRPRRSRPLTAVGWLSNSPLGLRGRRPPLATRRGRPAGLLRRLKSAKRIRHAETRSRFLRPANRGTARRGRLLRSRAERRRIQRSRR